MVRIKLDITKSVEENASRYYEEAKKYKKKIEGAKRALEETKLKLEKIKKEHKKEKDKENKKIIIPSKREWYEKFRWFFSSEKFLVIGGRDATTNELIIKKYTSPKDIVFHTDMAGSPFFVIKVEDKKPSQKTLKEAADATVTFSRAWKLGLSTTPVFYVKPEQITKKAKPGEYLQKGAFMIYGKTNYIENMVNCAVGLFNNKIMAGPVEAIKANCKEYVVIEQGNEKTSLVAKYIQKRIGGNIDDIIRVLPSGGCKIKKPMRKKDEEI